MSASSRMRDTIWAPQRGFRPQRHPYRGEREVRPSCRNWLRWYSGRDQPDEQKSYPHASIELQWRRPPCARESSCLRARLLPWRDVAAQRPAPGLLNAVQKGSLSYQLSCPIFILSSEMDPLAWVGQTRIHLAGGRGHCSRGQPRFPSVAC